MALNWALQRFSPALTSRFVHNVGARRCLGKSGRFTRDVYNILVDSGIQINLVPILFRHQPFKGPPPFNNYV